MSDSCCTCANCYDFHNSIPFSDNRQYDKFKICLLYTSGIIGGTGSAKSTLVQLVPRLYDVTEGCVKVGGVDVRDYNLEALRDQVSMVLQKNVLFTGTIYDNIRWGDENASDEEVQRMCKLAPVSYTHL